MLVAVGEEIDFVAMPHREHFASRRSWSSLFGLLGGEIVNPQVVGHAAAVALPSAELAKDAVVGELRIVRRKRAETAARQRKLFRQAAVDRDGKELADEIVDEIGMRERKTIVLLSCFQPMTMLFGPMRSATSSRWRVAVKVSRSRRAALGGHEIDLGVAVVLAGEGEPFAVGGKAGKHFKTVMAGHPPGDAAVRRDQCTGCRHR